MEILIKLILFFFFSFTAFAVNAECTFQTNNYVTRVNNASELKNIEILVNDSNKFAKNALRIITSRALAIENKYKKRFKAKVKVHYEFGECIYDARIRVSGDIKDHVGLANANHIKSSLDVKIKNGSVLGAVAFKLFLPETRNGFDEILAVSILRKFNYITPRTLLVNASINGYETKYLFQEKARKELLESSGRREGPIFEGDESQLWGPAGFEKGKQKISLARMENASWIDKGNISLNISLDAFNRIQSEFLYFAERKNKDSRVYAPIPITGSLLDNPEFRRFHLLLLAFKGWHGLSPNNRKFYFNMITDTFEPIYYDSNASFTLIDNFLRLPEPELKAILAKITSSEVDQILKDLRLLKNSPSFQHAIQSKNGVPYPHHLINKKLDVYIKNIQTIVRRYSGSNLIGNEWDPDVALGNFVKNTINTDIESLFVHEIYLEHNNFEVSSSEREMKHAREINSGELKTLLGDNKIAGMRAVRLPSNTSYDTKVDSINIAGGIIKTNYPNDIFINHKKQILHISQSAVDAWYLILGGDFADWNVEIITDASVVTQSREQRFNKFGLTGCLSFYESKFERTTLSSSRSMCEDSINIVRSSGHLKSITIKQAMADALDMDFSNIDIDELVFEDAGNDCFDVSSGTYNIGTLIAEYCADKAVSVGEKSILQLEHAFLSNALIGVASKDSSIVDIQNSEFRNVDTCLSAYNKKPEFFGGVIRIHKSNCLTEFSDKYSLIQRGY